jgi:signal transduction histidine kinase
MWRRSWIGLTVLASVVALAAGAVVRLDVFTSMQSLTGFPADPRMGALRALILEGPPVLSWTTAGCVVAALRPGKAVGWLFLACGLILSCSHLLEAMRWLSWEVEGATVVLEDNVDSPVEVLGALLYVVLLVGVPAVVLSLYLDGSLPARWWRWPIGVAVASVVLTFLGWFLLQEAIPAVMNEADGLLITASVAATIVITTFVHLRRIGTPMRQPLACFLGCGLLAFACRYLFPSPTNTSAGSWRLMLWVLTDPMLILPIGLAAGVLRHHLPVIPAMMRRGLVSAALAAMMVNVRLPLAAAIGTPLKPLLATGVMTGVVAAGMLGLDRTSGRLAGAAARLVHGARRNPLQALTELSDSVAENTHLDLVPAAVATVAAAVGADGAVLVGPDGKVLARTGQEPDNYLPLPVRFGGAQIGELRIAEPAGGQLHSEVEVRLLAALATQLAVVVSAAELAESLEAERNRVVSATRDERNRLRWDLHDGLGPSLAGMSLGLQALAGQRGGPDTPAGLLVRRLRSETDTAVRDIRRIIEDLRPTALDTAGLTQAVESHASTLALTLPVEVTATSLPVLAPDVEVAAYRIITEALTNTARHAHARYARVTITADEALHIAVHDDGCGIPAAAPATGLGLASMRRRAETLGGGLVVDSTGGGTTIIATLPLTSSHCL